MSCVATLEDLERICDITSGFEAQIFATEADNVESIGAATDGAVATITMKAGKYFSKIPVSTEGGKNKIISTLEGNSDGSVYKNVLTVFSPGISALKSSVIGDMRKPKGYIFAAKDLDGKMWLVGSLAQPATVKPGMNHDAEKGYPIEATEMSKSFPLEFTGTLPVTPAS